MGNIIVSNDIISIADAEITAQSTADGFDKVNVMDFWRLKRRWRMNTLTKSNTNPIMIFDLGETKTIPAFFLNDVNFDKVLIKGHASNLTTDWTAASFDSGILSISEDDQVKRSKVYIPATAFAYRWLAICVPTTASAVGSYVIKWEMGTVILLEDTTLFMHNMSPDYERGGTQSYGEVKIKTRPKGRTKFGPIRWEGILQFGIRSTAQEADLLTLNNMNIANPLVFYENGTDGDDTSKVYLCVRDSQYKGSLIYSSTIQTTSIKLIELV